MEERFQNLTQKQWSLMLQHYYNKKTREREEKINIIEYLAMLTSMNPKGVSKVISARKKQNKRDNMSDDDKQKALVVNENGENEFGQIVNTTFFADLEKYGGAEALKAFENPQDYKIQTPNEKVNHDSQESEEDMDEDDRFIMQAKRFYSNHEKELAEEEKFKKEHPELFEADSLIF